MPMHPVVDAVTDRVRQRSRETRKDYLTLMERARTDGAARGRVSCASLAHVYAAETPANKIVLREARAPNIAIVTAYNDMLSAHQPFATYPDLIKQAAREAGEIGRAHV